jgi:hypothetical protein
MIIVSPKCVRLRVIHIAKIYHGFYPNVLIGKNVDKTDQRGRTPKKKEYIPPTKKEP